MTTRAGFIGLLTGLAATFLLVYPLAIARPTGGWPWGWMIAAAVLILTGGWLAGRRSGSVSPARCAALGGLAGGLAGALVFCLLGAAAAGLAGVNSLSVAAVIRLTQATFLACFLAGLGLGALGGWLACPRLRAAQVETFDKTEPQMALNAAITAVCSSIVAAALAAAVFSRLAAAAGQPGGAILDLPLAVALLLVLLSQLALTLVVPHEAHQAQHLCGMDEVKMAAYVGIGAAPVLALLLLLLRAELFREPLVVIALLVCAGLSLKSLQTLFLVILPGRAAFPAPQPGSQKLEARLFGSIASSRGPRLVLLCIGCGLLMVLPLQVTVFATLLNLNSLLLDPARADGSRQLFLSQALLSAGLMFAAAGLLSGIYLFYLALGRWFSRWNSRRSG